MHWKFDQAPNVACIVCRPVIEGSPVLIVSHYEDDRSWSFMDGEPFDPEKALVVAMSTIIRLHPSLDEIAHLPPGWTASRTAEGQPWTMVQDA